MNPHGAAKQSLHILQNILENNAQTSLKYAVVSTLRPKRAPESAHASPASGNADWLAIFAKPTSGKSPTSKVLDLEVKE